MSRTKFDEGEAVMLRYRCGRCLAEAGRWCTVPSGAPAALLHAYRFHRAVADEAFAWQHGEAS